MDGYCARRGFTAVPEPFRDEQLFAGPDRDAPALYDQHVATLDDHEILVVVMNMLGGHCVLVASPERHLTPFEPVENVTLHSRGGLTRGRNPVGRMLHKVRKIVHRPTFHRRALKQSGRS